MYDAGGGQISRKKKAPIFRNPQKRVFKLVVVGRRGVRGEVPPGRAKPGWEFACMVGTRGVRNVKVGGPGGESPRHEGGPGGGFPPAGRSPVGPS